MDVSDDPEKKDEKQPIKWTMSEPISEVGALFTFRLMPVVPKTIPKTVSTTTSTLESGLVTKLVIGTSDDGVGLTAKQIQQLKLRPLPASCTYRTRFGYDTPTYEPILIEFGPFQVGAILVYLLDPTKNVGEAWEKIHEQGVISFALLTKLVTLQTTGNSIVLTARN